MRQSVNPSPAGGSPARYLPWQSPRGCVPSRMPPCAHRFGVRMVESGPRLAQGRKGYLPASFLCCRGRRSPGHQHGHSCPVLSQIRTGRSPRAGQPASRSPSCVPSAFPCPISPSRVLSALPVSHQALPCPMCVRGPSSCCLSLSCPHGTTSRALRGSKPCGGSEGGARKGHRLHCG